MRQVRRNFAASRHRACHRSGAHVKMRPPTAIALADNSSPGPLIDALAQSLLHAIFLFFRHESSTISRALNRSRLPPDSDFASFPRFPRFLRRENQLNRPQPFPLLGFANCNLSSAATRPRPPSGGDSHELPRRTGIFFADIRGECSSVKFLIFEQPPIVELPESQAGPH